MMKINYNPDGKWSVESVQKRYRELSLVYGGVGDFFPEPKVYINQRGAMWTYNIMKSVVDGVQLGDKACIQLSIEYIQDNLVASTTGYIRERMARALCTAELSNSQKKALVNVFLTMLENGNLQQQFREYIRLFKYIGIEPYLKDIERYRLSEKQYIRRAAEKLLTK
ncbi:hypothetical protein [Motilimonas cestriensis]|uniref:hypothetical protein n=1 Tax=Motilimonas cestriensis TaxID=2742685 RepID=UPI003DA3F154